MCRSSESPSRRPACPTRESRADRRRVYFAYKHRVLRETAGLDLPLFTVRERLPYSCVIVATRGGSNAHVTTPTGPNASPMTGSRTSTDPHPH